MGSRSPGKPDRNDSYDPNYSRKFRSLRSWHILYIPVGIVDARWALSYRGVLIASDAIDEMTRAIIHLILHALVPGLVAWLAFRPRWRRAWLIMLLTMAVDLDHLLADPIYDPNRCGVGFHPLHSTIAITAYAAMVAIPKLRIVGIGLLIHMVLDGLDCMWIGG